MADVIPHGWYDQCVITVAKIKNFFSFKYRNISELLDDVSGTSVDLTEAMELEHRLAELSLLTDEEYIIDEETEKQVQDPMLINLVGYQ